VRRAETIRRQVVRSALPDAPAWDMGPDLVDVGDRGVCLVRAWDAEIEEAEVVIAMGVGATPFGCSCGGTAMFVSSASWTPFRRL
jgi:hypothetical protein